MTCPFCDHPEHPHACRGTYTPPLRLHWEMSEDAPHDVVAALQTLIDELTEMPRLGAGTMEG